VFNAQGRGGEAELGMTLRFPPGTGHMAEDISDKLIREVLEKLW
jgi:hypothetical protein